MRSMRMARVDLATPAEQKIREAMELVEGLGADIRLTNVITSLSDALEELGEYQDEKLREALVPYE